MDANPPDPWDRFGWIMSVIWLVFLAYPVVAAFALDSLGTTLLALALIATFAAIYVYSFVAYPRTNPAPRVLLYTLLVLIAIVAALTPLIGEGAASALPFIVAYAMFFQPIRRAIGIVLLAIIGLLTYIFFAGWSEPVGIIPFVIVLVATATGAARWIADRQAEHTELRNQYRLISERERVARDVHDVLGHSLTIITLKAELARRLVDSDSAAAVAEISDIESLSRQSLAEVRSTVSGLRVMHLAEELSAASTALRTAGVRLTETREDLDAQYHTTAAWIIREAVTNIIRHAQAHNCHVTVGERLLIVEDDGRGIDSHVQHHGSAAGLHGIRERVEASNGTLEVSTPPGGGTRIEVTW